MGIKKSWYRFQMRRAQKKLDRKAGFRHFRRACRRAERYSALNNGKTYKVYLFDEYKVWSKDDIVFMKNRGVIARNENVGILSRNIFYTTDGHHNLHPKFRDRVVYHPNRKIQRVLEYFNF